MVWASRQWCLGFYIVLFNIPKARCSKAIIHSNCNRNHTMVIVRYMSGHSRSEADWWKRGNKFVQNGPSDYQPTSTWVNVGEVPCPRTQGQTPTLRLLDNPLYLLSRSRPEIFKNIWVYKKSCKRLLIVLCGSTDFLAVTKWHLCSSCSQITAQWGHSCSKIDLDIDSVYEMNEVEAALLNLWCIQTTAS